MEPTKRPRVKVCCIASVEEARLAIDAARPAIGLVSKMPSGPGPITDEEIATIAAEVPPGIDTFLLTARQDADAIIDQHRQTRTSTLQLVDDVSPAAHQTIRAALPGIRLVQVIHVTGKESVAQAEGAADTVDAILLDSGNPSLEVKELGGTGRRHDWLISREIRERVAVPVFLAGGLRPENVRAAIATVRPFGLDVCSGLRDAQLRLDPATLTEFMAAAGVQH